MLDVAQFFDDGALFPPLPDDLDDLFTDDLMHFLKTTETVPVPAPAAAPAVSEEGQVSSCSSQSEDSSPFCPEPPAATAAASKPSAAAPVLQQALAKAAAPVSASAQPTNPTNCSSGTALRLVTTQLAGMAAALKKEAEEQAAKLRLNTTDNSRQASGDMDSSGDSSDTDEDAMQVEYTVDPITGLTKQVNKRKAPEVDWRSIEDPSERRRQRRLAKNRVTAARSRERKKSQWADMEVKLQAIENENHQLRAMLEQFARENSSLKDQLLTLSRGAATRHSGLNSLKGNSTEPAVLIFIATLLVLTCFLPGDKAMMMGSAVPLMLIAQMLRGNEAQPIFDVLFQFLAMLKTTLSKSSKTLKRGIKNALFRRHHFFGRTTLQKVRQAAEVLSIKPPVPSLDAMANLVKSNLLANVVIKTEVMV